MVVDINNNKYPHLIRSIMTIVNYEVTFHIPAQIRQDVYIVTSTNFLEHFNRLFGEYEEKGVDFSTSIKHTDTQIIKE
jgi:hypothetical protein